MIWIDANHISLYTAITCIVVSFFFVIYILWTLYLRSLAQHITLCSCSAIFSLCYNHTSCIHTSAAKAPHLPATVLHHSLWPLTTFQITFHGFHAKDQSNKKPDLLPSFTLHDFMFSEKKMKKLMKSIDILLNSLKDQMNLNRFIILQKKQWSMPIQ